MKVLATTEEVIDALGGREAVGAMFRVTGNAVDHWRAGKFPAHTFLDITEQLGKQKLSADPELWKFARALSARRKQQAAE